MQRALSYVCGSVIVMLLHGCGGTVTHRGEINSRTSLNLNENFHFERSGCDYQCNQLNPDGSCAEWFERKGTECRDDLGRTYQRQQR